MELALGGAVDECGAVSRCENSLRSVQHMCWRDGAVSVNNTIELIGIAHKFIHGNAEGFFQVVLGFK